MIVSRFVISAKRGHINDIAQSASEGGAVEQISGFYPPLKRSR
jgi:hypothetical protein